MKKTRLNRNGFSLIEIVVAIVVVVGVAGLGFMAYNNRSSSSDQPANSVSEESSEGEITEEEAEAIKADAAGSTLIKTSDGKFAARVCTYNRGTQAQAIFFSTKNWKNEGYKSPNQPRIDIKGYGKNTGKNAVMVRGGQKWWLGTLQKTTGNVPSWASVNSDYIRMAYGSNVGPYKRFSSVPQC